MPPRPYSSATGAARRFGVSSEYVNFWPRNISHIYIYIRRSDQERTIRADVGSPCTRSVPETPSRQTVLHRPYDTQTRCNRAPPGQSVALQPSASAHSAAARNTPFNGAASECTQLPQHSADAMPQSRPKTRPNLAYRTTQKQNTPYPIVTQHFHCGVRVKGRRSPHRRRVHPAAAPQTCVA